MIIQSSIKNSIKVKEFILKDNELISNIENVVNLCIDTYNKKGKIMLCGNGGSASDAQHISAELTGRFYYDRGPLNSIALHTDTSYLTAVSNDYSFDNIYSRLVKGIGYENDILIGLSTSGKSKNIYNAFIMAKKMGIKTILMTGNNKNCNICKYSDIILNIPSIDTPRIQESHIMIGHILCENIEKEIFPNG